MSEKSDSWTSYGTAYLVKRADKSAFIHRGSTVPKRYYSHFKISDMSYGERREVTVILERKEYSAYFIKEKITRGGIRLFWDPQISEYLCENFSGHEYFDKEDYPDMIFKPVSDLVFELYIVSDEVCIDDVDYEDVFESYADGKESKICVTRRKRVRRNRENAIKAHGRRCMVCDFDFGEHYGIHGVGFIEVHHKVPLSTIEGEMNIDPIQDMACLCSNCHRIIHRRRNNILSVEELQEYYDRAQEERNINNPKK